jgi:hypothetical protein
MPLAHREGAQPALLLPPCAQATPPAQLPRAAGDLHPRKPSRPSAATSRPAASWIQLGSAAAPLASTHPIPCCAVPQSSAPTPAPSHRPTAPARRPRSVCLPACRIAAAALSLPRLPHPLCVALAARCSACCAADAASAVAVAACAPLLLLRLPLRAA